MNSKEKSSGECMMRLLGAAEQDSPQGKKLERCLERYVVQSPGLFLRL
jgi:hypothetical protein